MSTEAEIKGMKVAELRAALEGRGLPSKGLKAELAERLLAAVAGGDAPAADTSAPPEPAADEPAAAAKEGGEEGETPAPEGGAAAEAAPADEGMKADAEEGEAEETPAVEASLKVTGLPKETSIGEVKDLARKQGELRRVWVDSSFEFFYASYNSPEEADRVVAALNGLEWEHGSRLVAERVTEAEYNGVGRQPRQRRAAETRGPNPAVALRASLSSEALDARDAEIARNFTLTTAEPRIYFCPWNDEEVAERAARVGEDGKGPAEADFAADQAVVSKAVENSRAFFAKNSRDNGGGKRGRDGSPGRGGGGGGGGRKRKRRRRQGGGGGGGGGDRGGGYGGAYGGREINRDNRSRW